MSESILSVKEREAEGKNANRRLRKDGEIPAVVYGEGRDPIAIRVGDRQLRDLLRKSGDNAVFLLEREGTDQKRHAMIRDIQYNPLNGAVVHIDFQRIDLAKKVRVSVPIELLGTPVGVKTEDGIIDFVTREIEVECLPGKIPSTLQIDISHLHAGQHVEISALELPEGVEVTGDETSVIASVAIARAEEEVEVEEGVELLEAAAKEPEVEGRGKAEDD